MLRVSALASAGNPNKVDIMTGMIRILYCDMSFSLSLIDVCDHDIRAFGHYSTAPEPVKAERKDLAMYQTVTEAACLRPVPHLQQGGHTLLLVV